ncbi:glutaredoxin [bacterium]|nr:glutaredoxin [bacterium]
MNKTFVVYSKPGCPSCVNAKNLIEQRGDSYIENVLGQDVSRDEFVEMFPSVKTVPYIIEQGAAAIGGYTNLVEWYNENEQ